MVSSMAVDPGARPPAASAIPSIISPDLTIRGELSGAGDLQVEGRVIGRIDVAHLVVAPGGVVEGEIVAKAARISGTLNGSIHASSVTLAATARVTGDVYHEILAIEAGAQLEGHIRRITPGVGAQLIAGPGPLVAKEPD